MSGYLQHEAGSLPSCWGWRTNAHVEDEAGFAEDIVRLVNDAKLRVDI